jgi:hypothetical protein
MDSFRGFEDEAAMRPAHDEEVEIERPPEIGVDERRMHVRAYNYWVSLLDGRPFPSIQDVDPQTIDDFGSNSVLLDFSKDSSDPDIAFLGRALRTECGLDNSIQTISQVPSRSLLSRLTDHYLQIIANRAPIGFEAEFVNQRGESISYRGILMPFSSDGDTIDFIYGVINWKRGEGAHFTQDPPQAQVEAAPLSSVADQDELVLEEELAQPAIPAEGEVVEPVAEDDGYTVAASAVHFSWEDGPLNEPGYDEPPAEIALEADAGLADRLWAARETADAVKVADGRSRSALYRALAYAYDFALAAELEPEDYAELLEESGMKAQARAPMTAIVKLVFGIDYDKARLTEFASALSYARRQDVGQGEFLKFIEGQAGGLKALVAAERQAKRPEPKADTKAEAAKAKLRAAAPIALETVSVDSEFALVLTRRRSDGGVEPVALVVDEAMVEKAIKRAGL